MYLHFSTSWTCAISATFQQLFSNFWLFVNLTYYICTLICFKKNWCWTPCILASYFWLSLFLRHTVDTVWRALCCEELMSKMLCDSFLVASLDPEGSKYQPYSHCFWFTISWILVEGLYFFYNCSLQLCYKPSKIIKSKLIFFFE